MRSSAQFINLRLFGLLVVAVCAIGACLYAKFRLERFEPSEYVGPVLPKPDHVANIGDFISPISLKSLEGSAVTIGGKRARQTLVHFWASWCLPCVAELPSLEAAIAKLKAHNIDLVFVALDDRQHAEEAVRRSHLSIEVLISDGAMVDPVIAFGSKNGAVPFNALLAESGIMLKQHLGGFAGGADGLLSWARDSDSK